MWFFEKMHSFVLDKLIYKLSSYGFEKHHLAIVYFSLLSLFFVALNPWIILLTLKIYFYTLPFVAPFVLIKKIRQTWMKYARMSFLHKQKKVLFEIILPKELKQSPVAMEEFLSSIHVNPGESTFIATLFQGSTRPYWSFELVSIEGELHMYIWTWEKFKDMIESQFYAHFPDVELLEVEDYMNGLEADLEKLGIWGTDYKLTKSDAYPIKSYREWQLDKLDSFKNRDAVTDPLNSVFEKFASLGEGEVAILHIMFQYTRNKNWQKEVEEEIESIYKNRSQEITDLGDPEKVVQGWAQLRPQDYDLVNTLRYSTEKDAYDVGIRSLYIARKEDFKPGIRVGANHVNLFRSFEAPHLNDLKGIVHWLAGFDYPWHDPKRKIQDALRKKIIDAMKRRSYFHPPYVFKPLVLTTEELATIFHLPISRKSISLFKHKEHYRVRPPSNLPT